MVSTGEALAGDLAVRQGLLEVLDSRIGDLGADQVEPFQLREPLQMDQPHVGDLGAQPEIGCQPD